MENFLYIAVFHGKDSSFVNCAVSLKQVKPSDGSLVCAGHPLVYECVTSIGVTWIVDGISVAFLSSSKLNTPKCELAGRFCFELTETNGSLLVSTATILGASPNDIGIELRCKQGSDALIEVVAVSGKL